MYNSLTLDLSCLMLGTCDTRALSEIIRIISIK